MSLHDETDWLDPRENAPPPRERHEAVKDLPPAKHPLEVLDGIEVTAVEAVALRNRTAPSEVAQARADAFTEALAAGLKPKAAAREAQTSLTQLVNDPTVQAQMKGLLEGYYTTGQIARMVVRAKAMKVLLEGEDKDALNAGKLLAQDPELGMHQSNQPASTHVHFTGEVQNLLLNAPAIPGFAEDTKDE